MRAPGADPSPMSVDMRPAPSAHLVPDRPIATIIVRGTVRVEGTKVLGTVWRTAVRGKHDGMTVVGFHASHEQVHPAALLEAVQLAEEAGFTAGMCSDHFSPWSERQGQSGFAWSWLGAALQATDLPFGVVNAPGQRYHPAIVAQAAATLAAMFPGRFWVALGTGEASNEHITGAAWPRKAGAQRPAARVRRRDPRAARRRGGHPRRARHASTGRGCGRGPTQPPPLLGAAVSVETARWVAEWADGLVTVAQPHDAPARDGRRLPRRRRPRPARPAGPPVLRARRRHGARDRPRPVAHQRVRAAAVLGPRLRRDVRRGRQARAAGGDARLGAGLDRPGPHAAWLQELADLGFDEIYLHHVGQEQREFLDVVRRQGAAAARRHGRAPRARHEDHRHQRPVVEDGRRLLPRRRDVPRLGRRRHGRPRRASPSASTTWPSSASPACGSCRSTRRPTATTATTSPTSTASTPGWARTATSSS